MLDQHGVEVTTVDDVDRYAALVGDIERQGDPCCVVAAGGDGTVSLVVNLTPAEIPIAIMPLGTENLLAKQLGVKPDADFVFRVVCSGRPTSIDAGDANGRLFLLMAGCGFDAEVVQRLHRVRKGHIHRLSYAKPILDSIRSYEYPELRVYCEPRPEADQGPEAIRARWVFAVNLPRYAGGLQIAPQASGSDGLLDVCTFKEGSLINGLWYLSGVALGYHEGLDDFQSLRASRLRVESEQPVPYQLDGDPGGTLPVDIRVLPARATVLVPPE